MSTEAETSLEAEKEKLRAVKPPSVVILGFKMASATVGILWILFSVLVIVDF